MNSANSPRDLFFDQLRDMYSLKIQLFHALPEHLRLADHSILRNLLRDYLVDVDIHSAEISEIFIRFHILPGDDKCKAVEGLLEGAEVHAKSVSDRSTRDLMMVAHCLRICHYATAACVFTMRLAERLEFLREARTLATMLACETRTAAALLELEPEIFHIAQQSIHEASAP